MDWRINNLSPFDFPVFGSSQAFVQTRKIIGVHLDFKR
jgi:hypothetical protein